MYKERNDVNMKVSKNSQKISNIEELMKKKLKSSHKETEFEIKRLQKEFKEEKIETSSWNFRLDKMKQKLHQERLRNSTKSIEEERRLINEEFSSMKKKQSRK